MGKPCRAICFALVLACLCGAATNVDPPLRLYVYKLDNSIASGSITAYDADGLSLRDDHGQPMTLKWAELSAQNVYSIHVRLFGTNATGQQWLDLARQLAPLKDGEPLVERVGVQAVRRDPSLADDVAAVKKQAAEAERSAHDARKAAMQAKQRAAENSVQVASKEEGAKFWGNFTPEQQTQAITGLKSFAEKEAADNKLNLTLYETQFFLFYSDMLPLEAKRWQGLLDQMYGQLGQLFGVPNGKNIWRGKALVIVLINEDEYLNYMKNVYDDDARGTAGKCLARSDGFVHIVFYRQPNEKEFAHVLVHESTHGYLHRYRSPIPIISWLNEGMAEVTATDVVALVGQAESKRQEAREMIQDHHGMGDDFFTAEHIDGYQYPIAQATVDYMIRQNRAGFVQFVNGIKDGMDWQASLQKSMNCTQDQLVAAVYQSIHVVLPPGQQR